ncbi:Golgi apyrase [Myotisia sp. PD_48]|nr:Golgi apyrase [Myotisia sp. PD_48]
MGKWKYAVVLDAGSSGTRAHIYHWVDPSLARGSAKELIALPKVRTENGWAKKIRPGVSEFAKKPEKVGPDHLKPLLEHVIDIIHPDDIPDTPIFLLATAGMRLLSKSDQNKILHNVCSYMRDSTKFLLPDCDLHVKVIDGKTEGLYGWIATNYLLGGFDKPTEHDHGKGHHTYGFLDMGGASAQLAFAPNATEAKKHADDLTLLRLRAINGHSTDYGVFVTSWLGFGVRQARNRYVEALLKSYPIDSKNKQRPDPCLPVGLRTTPEGSILPSHGLVPGTKPYLVGTGEFDSCLRETIPLLAKDVPCEDEPCLLGGVHVPAIDFDVNHFVGISEYWHTTHEIFDMGYKDKAYDFETYQLRVKKFCSQDWNSIKKGVSDKQWGKKVDQKAAYEVCFKAAWIVNILHDGIGIPRAEIESTASSNNGTKQLLEHAKTKGFVKPFQAVNKIDSTEVSWTLGKAVLFASSQVPPGDHGLPVGFGSNEPGRIPSDFQHPAAPSLPSFLPKPPSTYSNGTTIGGDHWHDNLFAGESPRRIPGIFLFSVIVIIAIFFLCGRERRSRLYRKFFLRPGRGPFGSKGPIFGGKIPFLSRHPAPVSYERLLEEGAHGDFELSSIDSDEESQLSASPPMGERRPSSSIPTSGGRNHHHLLKYNLDNTSSLSVGSALDIGNNNLDRNGLVIRTESRERLAPFALSPTFSGRRSRATSPTRLKTPIIPG